jgi:DNA-binding IclR family transcriptional regulator
VASASENGHRPLQVLERAFALLDLFTLDRPEWTTTELARSASLPVTTVHRILAFLLARGYVVRDEQTKRFRLGPAARDLGGRARPAGDLRRAALPVLERLALETDETALLTVPSERRDASVCLERVESSQPLRLSVEPGRTLPLHAGASQKALLAFMAEDEVERVLAGRLERLCRTTITEPGRLRADLERVRRRGWAISDEETNLGVWGVAVPLLDQRGLAAAALGLAGPSARRSEREVRSQVALLRAAAAGLAQGLGLSVPGEKTKKEALAWR